MSYSLAFDPESKCILVSVSGELNLQTLKNIASEVSVFLDKHSCICILNDLRKATMAKPSSTYSMPEVAVKAGVNRAVRRALVTKNLNDFHFLETVFINRGNVVKLFDNINEARAWLMEGKSST